MKLLQEQRIQEGRVGVGAQLPGPWVRRAWYGPGQEEALDELGGGGGLGVKQRPGP